MHQNRCVPALALWRCRCRCHDNASHTTSQQTHYHPKKHHEKHDEKKQHGTDTPCGTTTNIEMMVTHGEDAHNSMHTRIPMSDASRKCSETSTEKKTLLKVQNRSVETGVNWTRGCPHNRKNNTTSPTTHTFPTTLYCVFSLPLRSSVVVRW